VTVCIAAMFRWNYASGRQPDDWGWAALTMSDRMITAGDVQYEPRQLKFATVSDRVMILVAGDFSVHSQAVRATMQQTATIQSPTPENVAMIYGRAIQSIKRRHAEDLYLAPLGLNTDTFLAQQREMATSFVDRLTSQMQEHVGPEVEAIIVGLDGSHMRIFTVDSQGVAHCWDDIGFAAVGSGGWHARSRLMQLGFTNSLNFAPALSAIYAAKKSAEVAPGVGGATDIYLIFRSGIERAWPRLQERLQELFEAFRLQQDSLVLTAVNDLQSYLNNPTPDQVQAHEQLEGQASRNAQADAGVGSDAAEAARTNEGRQEG
jgi:hypothetical protein